MINHHYDISKSSKSFHSCCRIFCDIEWSLSQKGIYVSLHGWIIGQCVQKKLWTCDSGDGFTVMIVWLLMFSTLIFISQISRTHSLGREAYAHYPPPLEPPPFKQPMIITYIVPFEFPSCNHGIHPPWSSKGCFLGCTNPPGHPDQSTRDQKPPVQPKSVEKLRCFSWRAMNHHWTISI